MSSWLVLTLAAALATVVLVCHRAACLKHSSEEVLTLYTKLLAEARNKAQKAAEDQDTDETDAH
ncbi:MAG: hypothetical protein ABIG44_04515 [Planctomycetota bacterium]